MDALLAGTLNKKNVLLTSLQGFERSRFLLNNELILLVKTIKPIGDENGASQSLSSSFKRILHICDKDQTVARVYNETKHLPFEEFDLKVAKYFATDTETNRSDDLESQESAQLIVCNLKHLFSPSVTENPLLKTADTVLIFDGITLENIEATCCEILVQNHGPDNVPDFELYLPRHEFKRLTSRCWSVILACNPPVDGVEVELGVDFPIVLNEPLISKPIYRTNSLIVTSGPTGVPMSFNSGEKHTDIHSEVGAVLENCVNQVQSGPIVVFFPSYGRMVEYHNAWQKSGLFARMNVVYGRENRAGDQFKNGLLKLARQDKSIFLFSIRYHKDETLAEFVLSLAKAVLVVGLPYPFTNDTWDARMKYNNEKLLQEASGASNGRLSGAQLYKYRAIELMNGVLKRCLNEFRYEDCNFYLLDSGLKFERNKIARELGDTQEMVIWK